MSDGDNRSDSGGDCDRDGDGEIVRMVSDCEVMNGEREREGGSGVVSLIITILWW